MNRRINAHVPASQTTRHAQRSMFGRASRSGSFFAGAATAQAGSAAKNAGAPLLQRDPKPDPRAAGLQKAKDELKKQFGLREVKEQNGVSWTVTQLRTIAAKFSKMSADEKQRLIGVTLVLTDSLGKKKLKGRDVTIAGHTSGTSLVLLTAAGVSGTSLHEAGHLIHHNAIENAKTLFASSPSKADLETARATVNKDAARAIDIPPDQPRLRQQIDAVRSSAAAYERADDTERAAKRAALEQAMMDLPFIMSDAKTRDAATRVENLRAFAEALLLWGDERDKAVGAVIRLDEFLAIVKKDKLAERRSAIFTQYAADNWPESPAEFFSEAYRVWVESPGTVKAISKDLAAWFKRGGHLGPRMPKTNVLPELLDEAGQKFLAPVTGAIEMIKTISPPPLK